jgi:hypothetical protein
MQNPKEKSKHHIEITQRLDVIIGLLLDLINKREIKTEGDQIYRLINLGLDIEGIANIIGKSKDKISKQIYRLKSKK